MVKQYKGGSYIEIPNPDLNLWVNYLAYLSTILSLYTLLLF
jgi:hypothetical protein